MSIKINYKNINSKKTSNNLVLFTDEKFSFKPLKKYISNLEFSYVNDLLKTIDLNKLHYELCPTVINEKVVGKMDFFNENCSNTSNFKKFRLFQISI